MRRCRCNSSGTRIQIRFLIWGDMSQSPAFLFTFSAASRERLLLHIFNLYECSYISALSSEKYEPLVRDKQCFPSTAGIKCVPGFITTSHIPMLERKLFNTKQVDCPFRCCEMEKRIKQKRRRGDEWKMYI